MIWDNSSGQESFIGMTRERTSKEEYVIDYLAPDANNLSRKLWRYPRKPYEQETKEVKLISCNVIATWDFTIQKPTFNFHNHEFIQGSFQSFYVNN